MSDTFKNSVKLAPVEEFLDYYFYRRVAHMMVPTLIRLRLTPNAITTMSFIVGLLAGYFTYRHQFIAASIIAICAIFLDCCDGQVARLTGNSSPMGRVMDGFFDAAWVSVLWIALYMSGYFQSKGLQIFPLMLASSISVFLHCWRFDAVKIKYVELVCPDKTEGDIDFESAKIGMVREFKRFRFFTAFLYFAIAFQVYFFVRGNEKKKEYQFSAQQRQIADGQLAPIVNAWSYLGEGHHNTLIILGLMIAPWSEWGLIGAFWMILLPMNIWFAYCEWRWWRGFATVIKTLDCPETLG